MKNIGLFAISLVFTFAMILASTSSSFARSQISFGTVDGATTSQKPVSPNQIFLAKKAKKAKTKKAKKAKKSGSKKCEGLTKGAKKQCLRDINKGAEKGKKKGWFK